MKRGNDVSQIFFSLRYSKDSASSLFIKDTSISRCDKSMHCSYNCSSTLIR